MTEKHFTDVFKFMRRPPISDMDLQALADDQLEERERQKLLGALELDEEARERYERLLEQKKLIQLWWMRGARDH